MIKSKKKKTLILFLKKVCDKDEKKMHLLTKLEKFHEKQEFKTIKNKSLKFLELYTMNLKIH